MLVVIHVLFGLMLAKYFPSYFWLFVIGIVAHFIFDMVPHWDNSYDKKSFQKNYCFKVEKKDIFVVGLDFLMGAALIIGSFWESHSKILLFGAVVSVLPDFIKIGYFTPFKKNKSFKKYLLFHSKIQKEVSWKIGLIIQVMFILFIFILFKLAAFW